MLVILESLSQEEDNFRSAEDLEEELKQLTSELEKADTSTNRLSIVQKMNRLKKEIERRSGAIVVHDGDDDTPKQPLHQRLSVIVEEACSSPTSDTLYPTLDPEQQALRQKLNNGDDDAPKQPMHQRLSVIVEEACSAPTSDTLYPKLDPEQQPLRQKLNNGDGDAPKQPLHQRLSVTVEEPCSSPTSDTLYPKLDPEQEPLRQKLNDLGEEPRVLSTRDSWYPKLDSEEPKWQNSNLLGKEPRALSPMSTFYQKLIISSKDLISLRLSELTLLIPHVHEMKIYYTFLNHLFWSGLIDEDDRERFTVQALRQTAKTSLTCEEACGVFETILHKCWNDGTVDEQTFQALLKQPILSTTMANGFPDIRQHLARHDFCVWQVMENVTRDQQRYERLQLLRGSLNQLNLALHEDEYHRVATAAMCSILNACCVGVDLNGGDKNDDATAVTFAFSQIVDYGDVGHIGSVLTAIGSPSLVRTLDQAIATAERSMLSQETFQDEVEQIKRNTGLVGFQSDLILKNVQESEKDFQTLLALIVTAKLTQASEAQLRQDSMVAVAKKPSNMNSQPSGSFNNNSNNSSSTSAPPSSFGSLQGLPFGDRHRTTSIPTHMQRLEDSLLEANEPVIQSGSNGHGVTLGSTPFSSSSSSSFLGVSRGGLLLGNHHPTILLNLRLQILEDSLVGGVPVVQRIECLEQYYGLNSNGMDLVGRIAQLEQLAIESRGQGNDVCQGELL